MVSHLSWSRANSFEMFEVHDMLPTLIPPINSTHSLLLLNETYPYNFKEFFKGSQDPFN